MTTPPDIQATERIRAIVGRSRLDTVTADLLWNAQTAADMRDIVMQRLPACPLRVALLAACGPADAA